MAWEVLKTLEQNLLRDRTADGAPQEPAMLFGRFAALAERIVDVLFDRQLGVAEDGYRQIRRLHDGFVAMHGHDVESSPGFLAGQLAAFAEMLGAASERRLPKGFEEEIKQTFRDQKFTGLLDALAEGELRTTDLAKKVQQELPTISRKLSVLRNIGIVVSYQVGREVFSTLSPAARPCVDRLIKAWAERPTASHRGDHVSPAPAADIRSQMTETFRSYESQFQF